MKPTKIGFVHAANMGKSTGCEAAEVVAAFLNNEPNKVELYAKHTGMNIDAAEAKIVENMLKDMANRDELTAFPEKPGLPPEILQRIKAMTRNAVFITTTAGRGTYSDDLIAKMAADPHFWDKDSEFWKQMADSPMDPLDYPFTVNIAREFKPGQLSLVRAKTRPSLPVGEDGLIHISLEQDREKQFHDFIYFLGRQTGKSIRQQDVAMQLADELTDGAMEKLRTAEQIASTRKVTATELDRLVAKQRYYNGGGFATVDLETDMRPRAERRGHKSLPAPKRNQDYLKLRKGKY